MTAGPLTWMGDVLAGAGLSVTPTAGWAKRGHAGTFDPRYIVAHHDASPVGPSPGALDWVIKGTKDVPGPMANLWVDFDGGWHLVASGLAWHAGTGGPYASVPKDMMNHYSIGIEVDQTVNEPWSQARLTSLRRGVAALLNHLQVPTDPYYLFHKTWAPGRKIDPWGLDLGTERTAVEAYRRNPIPAPPDPLPEPTRKVNDMLIRTPDGYVYHVLGKGPAVHILKAAAGGYAARGVPTVDIKADQVKVYEAAGVEFPK